MVGKCLFPWHLRMASWKACSNLTAAGRDWRLTWLVSSTVGERSKVSEWWAESQHSLDSIFTLMVTSQCHPGRAWLWRRGLAAHAGSTCVCLCLPPPESKCAATGAGQKRGLGPRHPGRPSFVRQHIPPPPSGGEPLAHHQKLSELDVPVWRQKSSKGLTLQCLWLWSQLHRLDQSFPGDWDSKESACNAGDLCSIPGSGKSLEREMATHSSMLVWRIPWTEEPGRLYSPWGRKESDRTERLTHFSQTRGQGWYAATWGRPHQWCPRPFISQHFIPLRTPCPSCAQGRQVA